MNQNKSVALFPGDFIAKDESTNVFNVTGGTVTVGDVLAFNLSFTAGRPLALNPVDSSGNNVTEPQSTTANQYIFGGMVALEAPPTVGTGTPTATNVLGLLGVVLPSNGAGAVVSGLGADSATAASPVGNQTFADKAKIRVLHEGICYAKVVIPNGSTYAVGTHLTVAGTAGQNGLTALNTTAPGTVNQIKRLPCVAILLEAIDNSGGSNTRYALAKVLFCGKAFAQQVAIPGGGS